MTTETMAVPFLRSCALRPMTSCRRRIGRLMGKAPLWSGSEAPQSAQTSSLAAKNSSTYLVSLTVLKIVRETRDGRMQEVEIKLADWVFNAIQAKEVLTLHRDYFRLRKPLERRIYELARKHCGAQNGWKISLALLQKK